MARDVIQLRPEIEELIREIAARPDSVLLRVPRGWERDVLSCDAPRVSSVGSGLRRAERHLIAVHREECAHVLRQAAWYRVATSSEGSDRIYLRHTATSSVAVPDPASVARDASRMLDRNLDLHADAEGLGMLERCVAPGYLQHASPEALCAAAHRLVPTCSGRMICGLAYLHAGRADAALLAFRESVQLAPSASAAALAWTNLGEAAEAKDRWLWAWSACESAIRADPSLVAPNIGSLWFSVRLGSTSKAGAAAARLEDLIGDSSELLDEHVQRFAKYATRMKRGWNPGLERTLRYTHDAAGPSVGRLFDALG